MLIMVFAVQLGWLPSTGRGATAELFGVQWSFLTLDGLRHLLLPALNLSLFNISLVMRLTRAGVRETLPMDFVKFARAKGLTPARVIFVHVLKNIMIPVVTVVGLELGSTIAFAVVTESVFAWPGMGKLIIDSINVLDRPVIVAYLMMIVLLFVTINLVVDLLYTAARSAGAARRQGREHDRPPAPSTRARPPLRRFDRGILPPSRRRTSRGSRRLRLAASAARCRSSPRPGSRRRTPTTSRSSTSWTAGCRRVRACGRRLHLLARHRRPGPRHALRHPLRPAHLPRRRRRLRAHRLRRSAPRSACSPPMSADAPTPPSCASSICSFPSRPSSSR